MAILDYVAHWDLNNGGGDELGLRNGTVTGTPVFTGQAMDILLWDEQSWITFPQYTMTGLSSISVWAKWTVGQSLGTIIASSSGSITGMKIGSSTITLWEDATGKAEVNHPWSNTTWTEPHNIIVTRNGTGNSFTCYLDGVATPITYTNTLGNLFYLNTIGISWNNSANYQFTGSIWDIAIWGRTLSASEAGQVYAMGPEWDGQVPGGPVIHTNLDPFFDGSLLQSFCFEGTTINQQGNNDFTDLDPVSSYPASDLGTCGRWEDDFGFSKPMSTSGTGIVGYVDCTFSIRAYNGNYAGLSFAFGELDTRYNVQIEKSAFSTTSLLEFSVHNGGEVNVNIPAPPADAWYTVTYTYEDATDTNKFYVNGVLRWQFTLAMKHSGKQMEGQTFTSFPDKGYHTLMDQIMIFNRTLSPTEVLAVHNAQLPPEPITQQDVTVDVPFGLTNMDTTLYLPTIEAQINSYFGSASLQGNGIFSANGIHVPPIYGSADIQSGSTLTTNGTITHLGKALLTGSSEVTTYQSIIFPFYTIVTGSASLSNVSSLTINGIVSGTFKGAASLIGASTLTADGSVLGAQTGSASLQGTSVLTAAGRIITSTYGSASIVSQGYFSVDGVIVSPPPGQRMDELEAKVTILEGKINEIPPGSDFLTAEDIRGFFTASEKGLLYG